MFWTVLALILWVMLGAFLSYYGDLQGRRWGKRRVHWFGLRPKHTAILITSLTGGGIALLTVVSLYIIAPPVRLVIGHGEDLIRTNRRILAELESRIRDARRKQIAAERAAQATLVDLRAAASERDIVGGRLTASRAALASVESQLRTMRTNNTVLAAQSERLTGEAGRLTATVARLAARQAVLTQQTGDFELVNRQIGKQNIALSRDNDNLKRSNGSLAALRASLTLETNRLTLAVGQLRQEVAGENAAYQKLLDANAEQEQRVRAEIAGLTTEREDLKHQRDALYSDLAGRTRDFSQAYVNLRAGRVSLRSGVELARLTIDAHTRPERAREQLALLLDLAAHTAHRFGAAAPDGGREVQIESKSVLTAAGVQTADEGASVNVLTDTLSGLYRPVVALVSTVNNCVEGEPALVEITWRGVTPIYKRGDMVASVLVDSRSSTDVLVNRLLEFLQRDVRSAAVQAGATPRVDPDTGRPEVGATSLADLFTLAERVRRTGGRVRITATARDNTTSADPIRLDFQVQRSGDGER